MDSPVWFITGATSGFGLQVAKIALSRGHAVIATGRNVSKLADLSSLGAKTIRLDVGGPEADVKAAVDEAHALHGRITHVFNAAGYILSGAVEETTAEEAAAVFEVNVNGTHKVCRAAIPYLRKQGYGVVVNFGSLGSWEGFPAGAHYCATKWAVSGLTESLVGELSPFGIKVCVVEPGYFRTSFLNEGNRVETALKIDAYSSGPAGEAIALLNKANNNQPGNPEKGALALVDVLTSSGQAAGREIPMRLLLGSDIVAVVRKKCNDTLELVREWEAISSSTDF